MTPRWVELLIEAAKECVRAAQRGDRVAALASVILTGLWSMLERGAACEPALIRLGDAAIKAQAEVASGLRGVN